jgi:hypothetical protein
MSKLDYDDPIIEERWCSEQRTMVTEFLRSQKLIHGRIGVWPAWHVAPYVSLWAVESLARPEWIGWWAICGDLPSDYISAGDLEPPQHPRKALRVFAQNWLDVVKAWKEGREIDHTRIGDSRFREDLGPLLESRGMLLTQWANDDSLWEDV